MSENKRVIHVKDLVIKADNVYIEPRYRPRKDPFFGTKHVEEREENTESERHRGHHKEESSEEKKENRGPFSWI